MLKTFVIGLATGVLLVGSAGAETFEVALLYGASVGLNRPLPAVLVKRRPRTWRGQARSFC